MKEYKGIDIQYVTRYQNNPEDLQAFEEIYKFYYKRLYLFAYSYLQNCDNAEEVVQLTFIKVVETIKDLKATQAFQAWLFKVCYRTILLHFRKEKKYVTVEDIEMQEVIITKSSDQKTTYEEQEIMDGLHFAISKLNLRMQSVAQLYYLNELKIKEISEILDIPEGTVKTRLQKLRTELSRSLKSKGITPTTYLGLGMSPWVVHVFHDYIGAFEISQQQISNSLNVIEASTASVSTVLVSNQIIKNVGKKMALSSMAAISITAIALLWMQPQLKVARVSFLGEPTNKQVEVVVEMNQILKEQPIVVTNGNKSIQTKTEDSKVLFVAKKNGEYEIQIGAVKETFSLSNIDQVAPSAKLLSYAEDTIVLELDDQGFGIDYTNSYAIQNGIKYIINEDNTIDGRFEGVVDLFIYDKVGNRSNYNLTIEAGV